VTFQGGDFEGGRVRQSRGGGGGGGGRGIAVGGGVVGLIAVVLLVLLQGGNLGDVLGALSGSDTTTSEQLDPSQVTELGDCTVEQANSQRDCRLSATAYALDTYWQPIVEQQGVQFTQPGVTTFEGQTDTGCGTATTEVGPFYCPPDQTIYLDLGFYDAMFAQLGATDGPLAEEYVTAHEYGHHIQNLLGIFDAHDRSGTGADSDSVRTELQADCFAGMWAGDAAKTKRPGTDVTFLQPITQEQLSNALGAAAAVGDDRIQQSATGSINPDTWTHGSAAERQKWFTTGYQSDSLAACDTFGAADLG
jgi:predicted metalloprotease